MNIMTPNQLLLDKIMKRTCKQKGEVNFTIDEVKLIIHVTTLSNANFLKKEDRSKFLMTEPKLGVNYPGFSIYVSLLTKSYPDMLHSTILESLDKWYGIAFRGAEDEGQNNCPLCKLYFYESFNCTGCPVKDKTGKSHCEDSPYQDSWYPLIKGKDNWVVYDEATFQAALDELYFLHTVLMDNLG